MPYVLYLLIPEQKQSYPSYLSLGRDPQRIRPRCVQVTTRSVLNEARTTFTIGGDCPLETTHSTLFPSRPSYPHPLPLNHPDPIVHLHIAHTLLYLSPNTETVDKTNPTLSPNRTVSNVPSSQQVPLPSEQARERDTHSSIIANTTPNVHVTYGGSSNSSLKSLPLGLSIDAAVPAHDSSAKVSTASLPTEASLDADGAVILAVVLVRWRVKTW